MIVGIESTICSIGNLFIVVGFQSLVKVFMNDANRSLLVLNQSIVTRYIKYIKMAR